MKIYETPFVEVATFSTATKIMINIEDEEPGTDFGDDVFSSSFGDLQ